MPARMGDKYATMAVAYLTCLDPTSTISFDGVNGPEEERSMTIAARSIEQVLLLLNEVII